MKTSITMGIVAEIEYDWLEHQEYKRKFDYDALVAWWGWDDEIEEPKEANKVKFRLYDDDDELYYTGWLYNDDQALVQQFVLDWAKADSGCTRIMVNIRGKGWTQEIG
jgi:hypothetical protein